jgi:hypothetical protein
VIEVALIAAMKIDESAKADSLPARLRLAPRADMSMARFAALADDDVAPVTAVPKT